MQQQLLARLNQSTDPKGILDVSKLEPGSKLVATVISSLPADRPRLMNYLKSTSEQKPAQNNTPQGSQSASRTTQDALNTLLEKPQIFSTKLRVLGKELMSFSEQPLAPKEKVTLTVRRDGQLQLIPKEGSSNIRPAETSRTTASINEVFNKTQVTSTPRAQESSHKVSEMTREVLHNGLKQYLPYQGKNASILTQLQKLNSVIDTKLIAKENRDMLQIFRAITAIVAKSPHINDLLEPMGLKKTIENSGALLESKIFAEKNQIAPYDQAKISTQVQKTNHENTLTNLNTDTKAELLRLLHLLAPLISNSHTLERKSDSNIDKLIQQLFSTKQPSSEQILQTLSKSDSKHAFAKTIQPLIFASLAKITSLQIRHLLQRQGEPTLSAAGGLFELPIRLGDYVFPLSLHIHEKHPEDKYPDDETNEKKAGESTIRRQWHVYMEFDLDELGIFASDIAVQEHHVKTKLWIQTDRLWSESCEHLDMLKCDLENRGIEVDELQCLKGTPPDKPIKIETSLVDIRT